MPGHLQPLQPQYIQESELSYYGLPDTTQEPRIVNYIQQASSLIDNYCGRVNTDGWGSLVWTTYSERLLLPEGRNVVRVSFKPLTAIDATTFANYGASGAISFSSYGATGTTNLLAPNTQNASGSVLSPMLFISGRYGYGRRAQQQVYPDLNYGANILQIASYFGGPPQFTPIAVTNTDFDPLTGEIWVPAGLYLSAYTEIFVMYNAGWAPDRMPTALKQATSMTVKNFLATPATNMSGFGVGSIHHNFTAELIDPTIDQMLNPYKNFLAM